MNPLLLLVMEVLFILSLSAVITLLIMGLEKLIYIAFEQ